MNSFDISVFNFFYQFTSTKIIGYLSIFFAEYFPFIIGFILIILIIKTKDWRQRFYFFSFTALSALLGRGIIAETIRTFYDRLRPFVVLHLTPLINVPPTEPSFPSGHATFYFALVLPAFYISKKWGWIFLISAIFISIARIAVGVHWPTDILAGAAIGYLSSLFIKRILPETKKNSPITSGDGA